MKLYVCKNSKEEICLFNAMPTRVSTGFGDTFEWTGYLNSDTDILLCNALRKKLNEIDTIRNMTHHEKPIAVEIEYQITVSNE